MDTQTSEQTMELDINIDDLLKRANSQRNLAIHSQDLEVLIDTNILNQVRGIDGGYNFVYVDDRGSRYNIVVLSGVLDETTQGQTHPEDYVRQMTDNKRQFLRSIEHSYADSDVSAVNEAAIKKAWEAAKISLKSQQKMIPKGEIGAADMQLISYAIDRARIGKKTAIISNDTHVSATVARLRRKGYGCGVTLDKYVLVKSTYQDRNYEQRNQEAA